MSVAMRNKRGAHGVTRPTIVDFSAIIGLVLQGWFFFVPIGGLLVGVGDF